MAGSRTRRGRLAIALALTATSGVAALAGSSAGHGFARAPVATGALPVDPLAGPRATRPLEAARERLAGNFAGAWIDRSGERPRLVVATTGSQRAAARKLAPAAARRGPVGPVEVVSAEASSAELARARRRAVEVLDRSAARFAVGVDPAAGAVAVRAPRLDGSARAAIQRRLGDVQVRFDAGAVGFRHTATCPACYPPFRGGLELRIGNAGCTSGFTMKRRDPPKRRGSRRGHRKRFVGITAGHCRPGRPRTVSIGGREVGRIDRNGYRGRHRVKADALRFGVRRSAKRPRVYIPTLGVDVPVRGRLRDRDMVPGTAICFIGISSGGGCSPVTRTNLTIKAKRKVQTGLWCIGIPAIPGDSGGPVMQPQAGGAVRAGGIVSGTLTTETSQEMCYSPISRVARQMHARLLSQRGG